MSQETQPELNHEEVMKCAKEVMEQYKKLLTAIGKL